VKVVLLDVKPNDRLVYKDWAGGFGTKFEIGSSLRARMVEFLKKTGAVLPIPFMGYIAAILSNAGHEVSISEKDLANADLVLMTSSLVAHNEEIDAAKAMRGNTNARTGFFGFFASAKPELYLPHCDFVIVGEPEQAVQKIANGFVPKGIVKSNPVELNSLPFPDWSAFNITDYSYFPALKKKPVLPILSSRGCPYGCCYCPYKVGYSWRYRSAESIVDEIEFLKREFGVKGIVFRDAIFTFDKARTQEFAKQMISKKLEIDWACETHLANLDKETIDLLYAAGLRSINVGIESANQRLFKGVVRTSASLEHEEELINYCDKKGVHITAFYILGLPDDTEQGILQTIDYAKKLNTHVASFTIMTPYPGTPFFEEAKNKIFDFDWNHYTGFRPVMCHKNLSPERLLELKEKAFTEYYFRPKYLLSFLRRMV